MRVMADRPPATAAAAARALSAHVRASAAACSAVTPSPTLPMARSLPSASGNCPAVYTSEPLRRAGTYEPAGVATGGRVRPSLERRSSGVLTADPESPEAPESPESPESPRSWPSRCRPLQVAHQLLRVRPGDERHELPAVITPVVQDLLGGVHQQRHGRVLPLLHGDDLSG